MSLNQKLDWKSGGFFLFIVLLPACVVGISNYAIFPELRWQNGVLLAITVGVAFLTHSMASEPVLWLRQLGVAVCIVLGIILCCNTVAHLSYARELNAGRDSQQERNAEEDLTLAREKERAAIQAQLAEAEARRLDAARKVLVQTPAQERASLLSRLNLKAAPITTPPAPTPKAATVPEHFATPEQVRQSWSGTILFLLVLDCVVSIVGGSVVWGARRLDGDNNGVPDFIQDIARNATELEFARARPADYARYGKSLTFASGK